MPSRLGFFSPTRTVTSGRGGRRARHQSGTRTTRPAASKRGSIAGTGAPRPESTPCASIDRAGIDQLGQPRHLLGGALQRYEEIQQRLAILARGGLFEGLRQRPVLDLAAGPRAHRIGGEEGERVILVAAVLGQVQADLADGVPRGMARVEPRGDRPTMRADLLGERTIRLGPARDHPVGVDVLRTVHRRHRAGQPRRLVGRAIDLDALALVFEVGHGAEAGHERAADVAKEREVGGERGVELGGAEVEGGVAGAALGGAGETGLRGGSETVGGVVLGRRGLESESPGGENRDADPGDRVSRRRAWHPRAAYQRRGPPMVRSPAPATLDVSFPGLFRLHRPGLYTGRWDGSQTSREGCDGCRSHGGNATAVHADGVLPHGRGRHPRRARARRADRGRDHRDVAHRPPASSLRRQSEPSSSPPAAG